MVRRSIGMRVEKNTELATFSMQTVSKTVNGKVVDSETCEGMPGVTVVVKRMALVTVTDIDCNYQLEADAEETLVSSFVGEVFNLPEQVNYLKVKLKEVDKVYFLDIKIKAKNLMKLPPS